MTQSPTSKFFRSLFTAALTALLLVLSWSGFAASPTVRPNFLLIIADDLNWRDLGCTGSPDVKTPNIDQLARESMSLRAMFTPAPTCSPLRHALYTGLFPIRSGAYPNHTMVDPSTRSIFTYLKALGYRVGLQAKSHVSPPESFPYEHISANADDAPAFAKFISRDRTQPWLAVFASHDPHSAWTRGPKNLYDPAKITVPSYLHDNATTRKHLATFKTGKLFHLPEHDAGGHVVRSSRWEHHDDADRLLRIRRRLSGGVNRHDKSRRNERCRQKY